MNDSHTSTENSIARSQAEIDDLKTQIKSNADPVKYMDQSVRDKKEKKLKSKLAEAEAHLKELQAVRDSRAA